MNCNCRDFRRELVNSNKEILSVANRNLQWKMFEQFLEKYFIDEYTSEDSSAISCSETICRGLAYKFDEYKRHYIAIPTLIMDVIVILDEFSCAENNAHLLRRFERSSSFAKSREFRIMETAFCGKTDIMKLLIDFGLFTRFPGDSSRFISFLEVMLGLFTVRISNGTWHSIAEKAMKMLQDSFYRTLSYRKRENQKRIFLAAVALLGIRLNDTEDYIVLDYFWPEHVIRCLKLYFTATRDVFLSVFEIRSVLYVCLKLTDKLHLFDRYCQALEEIMPECPAKIQPRTLAHLARCQIRQNLSASQLPLPSAIDKLFFPTLYLPMNLKSYLSGEILDISGERQHVSSHYVTQSELASLISKRRYRS